LGGGEVENLPGGKGVLNSRTGKTDLVGKDARKEIAVREFHWVKTFRKRAHQTRLLSDSGGPVNSEKALLKPASMG